MPNVVLPYTFRTAGARTPLNRLDANFDALAAYVNARLATVGPLANRPPAGQTGALYVASDQAYAWYLDDGATWRPVRGMGDGALTVSPTTRNLRLFGSDAGTDGQQVVTGVRGTAPTSSPPDVAQLYVADTQGEDGRARWTTRAEPGDGPRPVDPMLFRLVGDTGPFFVLSASIVETTVGSWTLRGGTLVGRALELAARYDLIGHISALRSLTWRVKLGATTLATCVLSVPIGATGQGVVACHLEALTAAIQRAAWSATPIWPTTGFTVALTTTDGALDATVDQPLAVTAQWNGGAATVNVSMLTVRLI